MREHALREPLLASAGGSRFGVGVGRVFWDGGPVGTFGRRLEECGVQVVAAEAVVEGLVAAEPVAGRHRRVDLADVGRGGWDGKAGCSGREGV